MVDREKLQIVKLFAYLEIIKPLAGMMSISLHASSYKQARLTVLLI